MKALTVKYPWSALICSGIKDIENRYWKTNFSGRIFIHEGNSIDSLFTFTNEQLKYLKEIPYAKDVVIKKKVGSSAIIGSVDIDECVIGDKDNGVWAEYRSNIDDKLIYNWILCNPILYETPISMKGALSLWESGLDEKIISNDFVKIIDIKSNKVIHTTKIVKYGTGRKC
jgi:hypothetical protein